MAGIPIEEIKRLRQQATRTRDDQLRKQQELIDSLRNRINMLEKTRAVDPRAIRPQ